MRKTDRLFFICGIFMLASELWKQYTLTFIVGHGVYDWWYFPFQLCSLAMYFCLSLPFIKSKRLRSCMITFLMTFSLLGGICTFFDTSGLHYPVLSLTVHSYLWHITLIVIGLAAGIIFRREITAHTMADCTILFFGCCLTATILNITLVHFGNINMFYISPYYYMNQVVFRDIAQTIGNGLGIIFYILTITAGGWILYLIYAVFLRIRP